MWFQIVVEVICHVFVAGPFREQRPPSLIVAVVPEFKVTPRCKCRAMKCTISGKIAETLLIDHAQFKLLENVDE